MSDTAIYDAFATLVGQFAAAQSLACAYPGMGFTPPTGATARWLELRWFPNQTRNYATDDEDGGLKRGFAQLSACYRPGNGIVVGTLMTDQIRAAFPKGTSFAGVRVYRPPWTSSVIEDPERVMHPVSIAWQGFAPG